MEQNIVTYHVSETAQNNFNAFTDKLADLMPGSFSLEEAILTPRKECSEAQIPLLKQGWMEDFVDDVAQKLAVNILYATVTTDGKDYKVIAYSMPYMDEMYIMQINSTQYGIVEGISVAFYDSMEKMFDDIKYHLQLLHFSEAEVLEQEDSRTTFSHFG